jgi:hypothetical protein
MPNYLVTRHVMRRFEEVWRVEAPDSETAEEDHYVDGNGDLQSEEDMGIESVESTTVEEI